MAELAGSELMEVLAQHLPIGARWSPAAGEEVTDLLRRLPLDTAGERQRLLMEAASVLSRCQPPSAPGAAETGLVMGYVQSGKTMSFTAVAALARDNGYRLVIVISGTTVPLFQQSAERLYQDLRLNTRSDHAWRSFRTILRPATRHRPAIADALAQWRGAPVAGLRPPTVLITAMKNARHLNSMISVLRGIDLSDVPALIIDDEADQAGLNNLVRSQGESATYRCLLDLRSCLPHHSYLEYTATPQAPLLINVIDRLSPRFAEVLTPGPQYVGGHDFFIANPALVEEIPLGDVPTVNQPLVDPPESLLRAMRVFFIGVGVGIIVDRGLGNRSMMIHPSQRTIPHAQYFQWVRAIRERWMSTLGESIDDPDRQELIAEFHSAYDDIATTSQDLPPFDAIAEVLKGALQRTTLEEVNAVSGKTPQIDWRGGYPFILVGGEVLGRGFTVEGLTVTYMPRGTGVGNADTIQQRARFLGYKREYLGLCRVFLESNVRDAYHAYVEHEEDVRSKMEELRNGGLPLSEWKRALVLTLSLRPTRAGVIDIRYLHGSLSDDWYRQGAPHESGEVIQENGRVMTEFLQGLSFEPDPGHPSRTAIQTHLLAQPVSLRSTYDELLTRLRITNPSDSDAFIMALVQIERFLRQNPDEQCSIYRMSGGTLRERGVKDGKIVNLFQGRNPRTGPVVYPGDQEIHASGEVSVQIHRLRLYEEDQQTNILASDVYAVAVWVPAKMSTAVLVQSQGSRR